MYTDLFGKIRYRLNLHMHTTLSDGDRDPVDAAQGYRNQGYDAVALTDHWFYGSGSENEDFIILPGVEYNTVGANATTGVWHIVGLGMTRQPNLTKACNDPQEIINGIRNAGGMVVLAHPAWSLNTPEEILALKGIDAVEIYNSASGVMMSRRADSSLIVDMLAKKGVILPLIAADDTHCYGGVDDGISWVMVDAEDNTREALMRSLRRGKFYSTMGPEIHLYRDGDGYTVKCSPASEIVFLSNFTCADRVFEGSGLTEAHYVPREGETYLRAYVVDQNGKYAWSNSIAL